MFSQAVEYALRAMTYLAEHPDEAAVSETISAAMQVPKPYLSKVLRELVRAKLIVSARGRNGGFVLARPATQVTALEIVNALDPIQRITTCPIGRADHIKLCPMHRKMDAAIEHVECSLRSTTLAQLVDPSAGSSIERRVPVLTKGKSTSARKVGRL
jgi:Rrf2 family transcriptional regulator, nitric oxide-sensitive transcriptional repressor